MTSMISSTVIIPSNLLSLLTTAIAFKSYFETNNATFSWSVSGLTVSIVSFVIDSSVCVLSEESISLKSAVPISF